MEKRVFEQGLNHHRRHHHRARGRVCINPAQEVSLEPESLNGEEFFQGADFPRQRFQGWGFAKQELKVVDKALGHVSDRHRVILAGKHAVERIENEVGAHLRLQVPEFVFTGGQLCTRGPHFQGMLVLEQVKGEVERAPETQYEKPHHHEPQPAGFFASGKCNTGRHHGVQNE